MRREWYKNSLGQEVGDRGKRLTCAVNIDEHGGREEGGDERRGSDKDGSFGVDFGPGIHDENTRDCI